LRSPVIGCPRHPGIRASHPARCAPFRAQHAPRQCIAKRAPPGSARQQL